MTISVFWALLMNTGSSSECLLLTGYLLWILTRRELKGGEWFKQKAYMENVATTIAVTYVVAEETFIH